MATLHDNKIQAAVQQRDFLLDWLQRASKEREAHHELARPWATAQQMKYATWALAIFQVTLIFLFATVGGSQELPSNAPGTVTQGYNMFIGVEIMMFVGFGYLMTFLKWYGLGAVGFTMLVTAVGLQWDLFCQSFFTQLTENLFHWHSVPTNIYCLLDALYAISAVLISFGALIGKISPIQLIVMTVIELALHAFNYKILMYKIGLVDIGGTYVDHMFGAYFGLAVAYMLGPPTGSTAVPELGNVPDLFSLIGTLFLWVYWPSFVAGAAEADSNQQARALSNTILALSASTICAFLISSLLSENKKFRPVDIQNATLAGGVAIGCTANLTMSAFSAIMIGCASGIWSTFGFAVVMGVMEERFKIHDTCGIHNLHAMPSVIGAIASIILAGYKESTLDGQAGTSDAAIYGEDATRTHSQWWRQWVAMITCMGFAILSGLLVGKLLKWIATTFKEESGQPAEPVDYHDSQWWAVAEDYGRNFYSELALVVKSVQAEIGEVPGMAPLAVDIDRSIRDFSSHHGRKPRAAGDVLESLSHHSTHNSRHGQQGGDHLKVTQSDIELALARGDESKKSST